uniref:Uncharacterized protein n=1 Tax=Branchiostoma floridae TaxID=7739 RepID=C3YXP4_BRAFL|eukprot:XP_002598841.1 hypothetical protein BRAFLDRAFT_74482 [Branchiostoma floridae]
MFVRGFSGFACPRHPKPADSEATPEKRRMVSERLSLDKSANFVSGFSGFDCPRHLKPVADSAAIPEDSDDVRTGKLLDDVRTGEPLDEFEAERICDGNKLDRPEQIMTDGSHPTA